MTPRRIQVHRPRQHTESGCLGVQKRSRLVPIISKHDGKEVVALVVDPDGWDDLGPQHTGWVHMQRQKMARSC